MSEILNEVYCIECLISVMCPSDLFLSMCFREVLYKFLMAFAFQLCIGYRRARWKEVIFWIFVVLTLGLLYLVTHWKPVWRVLLTSTRCRLGRADKVILQVTSRIVNIVLQL